MLSLEGTIDGYIVNGKPWTSEDRVLLLRLQDQGVKRSAVYGYFPNRTRCAVTLYLTKHGLFPVRAWTMRERDELRKLWAGGHSRRTIARTLRRSAGAVAFQVREAEKEKDGEKGKPRRQRDSDRDGSGCNA